MEWQRLLEPEIQKFIREQGGADVAALALAGGEYAEPIVLEQIKARQKAAKKVPDWLAREGVIFPPASLMEQASSAATAQYKAQIVQGENFVDLTGGVGVDAWAMAEAFKSGVVVEPDEVAASLLAHNMDLLTEAPAQVVQIRAEEHVGEMDHVDLVMIDPQRRDNARKGKYRFEDCSPNALEILPTILEKAAAVMIKASPMLDISAAIEALGTVHEVHVLEWQGECKEVVYVLRRESRPFENIPITAVALDEKGQAMRRFSFSRTEEEAAQADFSEPQTYLYDPSPAVQKAGCFKLLSARLNLKKLHPNTHVYTSDVLIQDFPGRSFEVLGVYPAQASKIPLKKANLKAVNFPQSTENLKKKLKIVDGGDDYLFACKIDGGDYAVIHCWKAL